MPMSNSQKYLGFEQPIADLQAKIESENKKKDDTVASTSKKLGLGTMRKVAAARKKKEEL